LRVSVETNPVAPDDIRALVIDDNATDAELSLLALRRAGMSVRSVVVHDESQLRAALLSFVPDVVLCDFSFPNFDGLEAQKIIHEAHPACPVIFVSGAISEELAAMALQSGAVDYVMKSTLVRLPIAVERAVSAARREAEAEKRAGGHVKRLETLYGIVNNPELEPSELMHVILAQAATDLSVQQRFNGYLCSGTEGTVSIVGRSAAGGMCPVAIEVVLALGALGDAGPGAGARTRSWIDAANSPDAPRGMARDDLDRVRSQRRALLAGVRCRRCRHVCVRG
jgi:CheY-like chemotaxis protein